MSGVEITAGHYWGYKLAETTLKKLSFIVMTDSYSHPRMQCIEWSKIVKYDTITDNSLLKVPISFRSITILLNRRYESSLISVMIWLVWSIFGKIKIIGLFFCEVSEFDAQVLQMKTGNFFIQSFGQHVNSDFIIFMVFP